MSKFETENGRGSKSCRAKIEERAKRQGKVKTQTEKKPRKKTSKKNPKGKSPARPAKRGKKSPGGTPPEDDAMARLLHAAALADVRDT